MSVMHRLQLEARNKELAYQVQRPEEPQMVLDQINDKTRESMPTNSGLVMEGETQHGAAVRRSDLGLWAKQKPNNGVKGTQEIQRKASPHDLRTHCNRAKAFSQPTFSAGFPNSCLCSNINQHDLLISSVFVF